jgi:regulatory protein
MSETEVLFESGSDGLSHSDEEGARDAYGKAMARAGRFLASRPRATGELRERLEGAGFEPPVVARVVARLTELGLLDDEAFARQWVEERSGRRGGAALIAELGARGVDRAVAERALESVGADELDSATALAMEQIRRVGSLPLRTQAARLTGALARRGYSPEVVREAVRAVLPPEGWD